MNKKYKTSVYMVLYTFFEFVDSLLVLLATPWIYTDQLQYRHMPPFMKISNHFFALAMDMFFGINHE